MPDVVAASAVDIQGPLTDLVRTLLLLLPKALLFIVILIVGWILAAVLRSVVNRVLEAVRFDRLVERGGVGAALRRSRYDASDIIAMLVFYAVLLFTLQLAFGIWGPNPVSDLLSAVIAWLPQLFVAILIVIVASAIAAAVKDFLSGTLGGMSYGRTVANLASWFILALGVIAALNQVGIATTVTTPILIAVLATVAGVIIVGVGGGLIRPMQARWDRWLDAASEETRAVQERVQSRRESDPMTRETGTTRVTETEYLGPEAGPPAPRRLPPDSEY